MATPRAPGSAPAAPSVADGPTRRTADTADRTTTRPGTRTGEDDSHPLSPKEHLE
jgi:hypothetical protein